MGRRYRLSKGGALSVGWLFADLLLALAMLFLLANTTASPKAVATPIPTPTPSPTPIPTPSPTPSPPRLELTFHRIRIQIDANGLFHDTNEAVTNVRQQIEGQDVLREREVGLVIAYGGAPNDASIPTAQTIATNTYNALKSLAAFKNASYYDPLYLLGPDSNVVTVDIYLFAQ